VFDLALADKLAVVEGIDEDAEGRLHVSVTLDDDPGRDLGAARVLGHRFFFALDEVEPVDGQADVPAAQARVLVAGVGNIFLGDDGFGVEVARRLAELPLPSEVEVRDFGIRGMDLAYALQDGYETTILVDAWPHGDTPGTLYVIEPDLKAPDDPSAPRAVVEAHAMNPVNVLRMARAMNIEVKNMLLVGCEPETLGGEEGQMGLSAAVEAAFAGIKSAGNVPVIQAHHRLLEGGQVGDHVDQVLLRHVASQVLGHDRLGALLARVAVLLVDHGVFCCPCLSS